MAKGDVIYRRSLCEIEVKELSGGEIIHLGPWSTRSKQEQSLGRSAQGFCHPWVGRAFWGRTCNPEGLCCRAVIWAGEKQDALMHQQRMFLWCVQSERGILVATPAQV